MSSRAQATPANGDMCSSVTPPLSAWVRANKRQLRSLEISGTFADTDIQAMLENATSEDGVLRDYWRENERRNAQHRQPDP